MDDRGFNPRPNVEDRRGEGLLGGWGGALKSELLSRVVSLEDLKLMLQHPMTPWYETERLAHPLDSLTPLGIEAGGNSINEPLKTMNAPIKKLEVE